MHPLVLAYVPGMFSGIVPLSIRLQEHPTPYRILAGAPHAPLLGLLEAHPLIRIAVPSDLRAREAVFQQVCSQVTCARHSQPPHIDHPHAPEDPRRYNVFWSEQPRRGASTYFIPLGYGAWISAYIEAYLCRNADAWTHSAPLVRAYGQDPLRLSRYRVPAAAVAAFEALVRHGEVDGWRRLTDFGRLTTTTRIMSNSAETTRLVRALLGALEAQHPGAVYQEAWQEPCVLIADDTRAFHGRLGDGESSAGFYRVWLSGRPAAAALGYGADSAPSR